MVFRFTSLGKLFQSAKEQTRRACLSGHPRAPTFLHGCRRYERCLREQQKIRQNSEIDSRAAPNL
jgi:hypothetical protein